MGGLLASVAAAALVFAGVLLPPGYALARLLRIEARGLPRAAIALGLGYSSVLSLVFLLGPSAGSVAALLIAAASLALLRPPLAGLGRVLRSWAPVLVGPLALAGLALVVNGRDFVERPGGASVGLGFDVTDKLFYAAVAQELGRAAPGAIENPVFAGLPLQYAFFPCVAGQLVHALTGAPLIGLFLVGLPALGILMVALAAQALLDDWGVAPSWVRSASAALVVLGGDLSFLVPRVASATPERFQHFFVFYSFSGEALYYNPWFFGMPLVLVALLLARRFLASGRTGDAIAAALVIGTLWETKAFACLALVAGSVLYGLVARRLRPIVLAVASLAFAAPWVVLTLASGAARGGAPLVPSFLYVVGAALAANPPLRALAVDLGVESPHALARGLAIALFTTLFVFGGLGLRLLGLPRLMSEARRSASGVHGLLLATLAVSLAAGLLVEGRPTRIEGVQFLLLAESLLWLYAGPVLVAALCQGALPLRALAAAACGVAILTPVSYAARKAAPEVFTRPGASDRRRHEMTSGLLSACRFLATSTRPQDRVAVPLRSPSDPHGTGPLLVAALSGRRVVGNSNAFHVDAATARARAVSLEGLYSAGDAQQAMSAIEALGARWVLVDDQRPLPFVPRRLALRHAEGGVSVYEVGGS